jgi:hypothetical protein
MMTAMRLTAVLALVALLVPDASSAQGLPLPRIGRRGPTRPAPLPPQAEPIARNLAYKRMRLSVESYPLISYVRSSGFSADGLVSDWTTFGMGTRADYRVARNVAVTLDLTSSFAGGPADVHTAELGTRFGSERSGRTLYRFADVRVAYVSSSSGYFDAIGGDYTYPGGFRYGSGFGVVAGAGLEYALTRTLSLTTAGSVMRNRMTSHTLASGQPTANRYDLTLFRYTLGIRYNPVRVMRQPAY